MLLAFILYYISPIYIKSAWFTVTFIKSHVFPITHAMHAHFLNSLNSMKYSYWLSFAKSAKIPFVINPVFANIAQNTSTNLAYARLYDDFFFLWKPFSSSEQVQTAYFFIIDSISNQPTFINSYYRYDCLSFPQNPVFMNVVNNEHFFNSLTPISLINYRSFTEFYALTSYTYNWGLMQSVSLFAQGIELVNHHFLKVPMHHFFKLNSPEILQVWHPLFCSIADGQYINISLVPIPLPHDYSSANLALSAASTSSLAVIKSTSIYYTAGILVVQSSLLFDLLEWELLFTNFNICYYKLFEIPLPWNLLFVNTEPNYLLYEDIKLISLRWEPHLYEFSFWMDRWVDDAIIEANRLSKHDLILTITYSIVMLGRYLLHLRHP